MRRALGANDGPDDAFENFTGWPELHALGASDEIARIYLKTWEGMLRQYAEAKTTEVPAGRDGLYFKEFSAQSDWMHPGEGLKCFNLMGLSMAKLPAYQARVRRFAGLYLGEDPAAPNYDVTVKIIRSMQNGSKGPMLRPATALDWVGDPFDPNGFKLGHGERTYAEFLDHYRDYAEVVGDHFINLVATVLPANAYLLTHEARYKAWIIDYMDAWLARMAQNGGVIPSHVGLDGKAGGADGRWWSGAYGWSFSPVNPVTGKPENRNRIARALVGFNNALLVTGDQKYVDAWRTITDAVNAQARTVDGQKSIPRCSARRAGMVGSARLGPSGRSKRGIGPSAATIARASLRTRGWTTWRERILPTPSRRCAGTSPASGKRWPNFGRTIRCWKGGSPTI